MSAPPIDAPDTELARMARELLHGSCAPHIVGHSERSFQFAMLLAAVDDLDVDSEALYIGTVLHDVGLADRFTGPDRFEVRGANVVRTMLIEAGMAPVRAENVWDVIALHASTAIASHKSAETRIANRGISIDVRGQGVERLDPVAVRAVLDAWPRQGFASAFARSIVDEVVANPISTRSSWLEVVAVGHVHGFRPADFLATLHASEQFV